MIGRKIKVFLGAYVNTTQAQALNCRALARHLDKDKFIVGARTVYSGDLPIERLPGVKLWHVLYPAKIWARVMYFLGVLWCDVGYMPSPGGEKWAWLLKLLHKKTFHTVEGVISGLAYDRAIECFGSEQAIRDFYAWPDKTFAITKAMIAKNREAIDLPDPDGVLYLGTDYEEFASEKKVGGLTDVILIGADLKRKGIDDYLVLAKRFPQLKFHVAGGAVGGIDYKKQCEESGLQNVVFHGPVSHSQLKDLLKGIQLHIFPSRAEGFPKVTLETAAAGVASLVYDDYGAAEWIASASADEVERVGRGRDVCGKSGFVVHTLDEMAAVVQALLDHPEALQPIADAARAMAKRFDWKVLVKDWEREIENLYWGRG